MTYRTSILDGVDIITLQARLVEMQAAYLDIVSGNKGESYSYTQGEGGRSVSFSRANIADLTQAIITVQYQIDLLSGSGFKNRRKPMRPYF